MTQWAEKMTKCDECGEQKHKFLTECNKWLCERCYIFHSCDFCESKGYSFYVRMAIIQFSKSYKLTVTTPFSARIINEGNSCEKVDK